MSSDFLAMSYAEELKNRLASEAKRKTNSILENEPIIQSDWKYTEDNDTLVHRSGHIDSKGRKQGRWKTTSLGWSCTRDYINGELVFARDCHRSGKIKVSIRGENKKTIICIEPDGKLQYFSEWLEISDSFLLHGWYWDTKYKLDVKFYCNNEVFVSLPSDTYKPIQRIRIIQRYVRRKAFVRRYLLFTQLKFMPLDVLSIIIKYQSRQLL